MGPAVIAHVSMSNNSRARAAAHADGICIPASIRPLAKVSGRNRVDPAIESSFCARGGYGRKRRQ
eukprot:366185-Chlamydomonas_euryale.AAC.1